jgi:hypothetical protein
VRERENERQEEREGEREEKNTKHFNNNNKKSVV